jgi:hypothetical protein
MAEHYRVRLTAMLTTDAELNILTGFSTLLNGDLHQLADSRGID